LQRQALLAKGSIDLGLHSGFTGLHKNLVLMLPTELKSCADEA
jgi:hypothetical protein